MTGAEERTNREDLSQNPKKNTQKENRNSDLSSLFSVCLLDASETSSDCALGDLSLKTGGTLTASERPGENLTESAKEERKRKGR